MEDEPKAAKKKRSKKDPEMDGDPAPGIEALAKLTSSDVIQQVKAGLSRIAPLELEPDSDEPFPFEELQTDELPSDLMSDPASDSPSDSASDFTSESD